jgi:hypothetical protein
MKEQKIQELLKALFGLTYNSERYEFEVIRKEHTIVVEQVIRQFLNETHDKELGTLQAKVKFYEEVIAKSTFAPMLIKEVEKEVEEIIEPEPYQREKIYTETQILFLANKVFNILGKGEVMTLFDDLLCIENNN